MLTRFKEKYIGDAAFYKRYLYLALPMILQNAITNLVSFLDNIMVGQLGTEQMSGVAIVNQLIFVYNLAIFGAASAASIFNDIIICDKGSRSDFPVSHRHGRKWSNRGGTAVWSGIPGHYDGWSGSICGKPVLCY